MGLLLDILLSFTPLGKIVDWGVFLFLKAIAAILRQFIWSVAVLVRRDEHPYDTEKWLDDLLYSKTLDEEEAEEIVGHDAHVDQEHVAPEAYEEEYDEDEEEETGDEEYLQYGHVDDMD